MHSMIVWTRILSVADCPIGSRKYVEIDDIGLAVFHLDDPDRFVVVENACPHAGGNLSAGDLENNSEIVCPWHAWAFDLDTGACTLNDEVRLEKYDCKVESGVVFANLNRQ
jgi:nitrite reductase/ring-hydroxylating ferredoxin subunit